MVKIAPARLQMNSLFRADVFLFKYTAVVVPLVLPPFLAPDIVRLSNGPKDCHVDGVAGPIRTARQASRKDA